MWSMNVFKRHGSSGSSTSFSASRLVRDGLFFVGGALIGWNLELFSRVDGVSMEPTLHKGDLLLHIPLWLWESSMMSYICGYDESTLMHHIVVMRVTETLSVCKRVRSIAYSADDVYRKHVEYFQPTLWADDVRDEQQRAVERQQSLALHRSETEPESVEHSETAAIPKDHRDTDLDECGADDTRESDSWDHRPFRRHDWDWCAERTREAGAAPPRWLWIEGDNPSDSFDSRHVGYLPDVCVKGVVVGRVWPKPNGTLR